VLIISGVEQYSINLAKEVAKRLKYRAIISVKEFVALNYGEERHFIKDVGYKDYKRVFNEVEGRYYDRVVVANGILRYLFLKLYYNEKLSSREYSVLRKAYGTYDHIVSIIPKITQTAVSGVYRGFKEGFTGVSMVVMGNLDPKKIILDFNVAKDIKKRSRRIAEIIAKKSRVLGA